MAATFRHCVLTGEPGCGKTTLICKLVQTLQEKGFKPCGFYTEERRKNRDRVGFDVVTLDGLNRASLASVCSDGCSSRKKPMVGKYEVDVNDFENIALPTLQISSSHDDKTSKSLLVIDEIGKMELFSKKFDLKIQELFSNQSADYVILATIPTTKHHALKTVEDIRNNKSVKLFQVTKANRNSIFSEIYESLECSLK